MIGARVQRSLLAPLIHASLESQEVRRMGVGGITTETESRPRFALWYASEHRWPVFPCHSAHDGACSCGRPNCERVGKHPRTRHGLRDATCDEAVISGWWTRWPHANIGVVTGSASGVDVLDIDPRHQGDASLVSLQSQHGRLPRTMIQHTGGGGVHYLFRHLEGVRNAAGIAPGLDVRGEGGYAIVPPSSHISGKAYAWQERMAPGEQVLAEWPDWLLGLMGCSPGRPTVATEAELTVIPEGQRNSALTSLAGGMRRRGMGEQEMAAALLVTNRERCLPPLPDEQVQRIAASVARYPPGVGNGRSGTHGSPGTPGPSAIEELAYPFCTRDGWTGYMKKEGRGEATMEVFVPLANFVARVAEERIVDNGAETFREWHIEGILAEGDRLPKAVVPVQQVQNVAWVLEEWGLPARLSSGALVRDRLREAIQATSSQAPVRCCYSHTGWRRIDGHWQYLHAGHPHVEVHLPPPLDRYELPSTASNVPEALEASLALLELAPDAITVPLLAATYLAPLCEFLHPDFALFLVGRTGSMKSTLAALFLAHYGDFQRTRLPGSWESTDNALERLLFTLKDVLCVVDDYAPRADRYSHQRLAQSAQRIIRGLGNRSSRSRLRANLSRQPDYPPRGLVLATGEDLPPGESVLARTLAVELEVERLDLEALTRAQGQAHLLPHAMASYINWLGPQVDEITPHLLSVWHKLRQGFSDSGSHLRTPEALAHLALGMRLFLRYVQAQGIRSDEECEAIGKSAHEALVELGTRHSDRVGDEDVADLFLRTLSAMLTQGTITLLDRHAAEGPNTMVGWEDDEFVYLVPEAARREVSRYLQDSGRALTVGTRALNEALRARGALVPSASGEGTRSERVGGRPRRITKLHRAHLYLEDSLPDVTAVTAA